MIESNFPEIKLIDVLKFKSLLYKGIIFSHSSRNTYLFIFYLKMDMSYF